MPVTASSPYVVRPAAPRDLRHLAAIEDAGLSMFEELWGDLTGDVLATPAVTGGAREDRPGFLLVTLPPGRDLPPVGFVHVLDLGGSAHLEQLSVHPSAMRQGLGSALVRASMEEARWRGHTSTSLCTYRDVPWNGPFYCSLGFAEATTLEPYQRRLRVHESELGLDRHGPRVVMTARLVRPVTGE